MNMIFQRLVLAGVLLIGAVHSENEITTTCANMTISNAAGCQAECLSDGAG